MDYNERKENKGRFESTNENKTSEPSEHICQTGFVSNRPETY